MYLDVIREEEHMRFSTNSVTCFCIDIHVNIYQPAVGLQPCGLEHDHGIEDPIH